MNELYKKKLDLVKELKVYFSQIGSTEVFTPIIRKTCSESMKRIQTEYGSYLRNCQEMQLRLMMEYYGDVFEIGSSFRPEECEDTIHGREFTLLEALFQSKDIEFLKNILKVILQAKNLNKDICEISVYEQIKRAIGIDLKVDGISKLIEYLKHLYPDYVFVQPFQLVNQYIHDHIEPLSRGKCVFFTQYPACTLSLARYENGTTELVRRYECFVDGIEISNGYEYSTDVDEFVFRNKLVNMYTPEEEYLENKLREKAIPTDVSVIGIGIERLCMILYGVKDIQPLLHENEVF